MTYELFSSMLKNILVRINLPVYKYSGHSFRRRGATHALNCGVPAEVIKAQGDWKSLAYLHYLNIGQSDRAEFIEKMYMS